MVMISAYFLFVFSDFVDSPAARYSTGFALIVISSLTIGVNVGILVLSTLRNIA
jgi:hypothetical protein